MLRRLTDIWLAIVLTVVLGLGVVAALGTMAGVYTMVGQLWR